MSHPPYIFKTARRVVRVAILIALLIVCRGFCLAQHNTTNEATDEATFKCDTAGVRLEGTLIERTFYGQPGFGETPAQDVRVKVLLVKLPHPITVEPAGSANRNSSASLNTIRNVREVQLYPGPTQNAEARKMLGKTVVAVGTLREAAAPNQYVDVSMDVKTLALSATRPVTMGPG
jgi:hypothetical protein